jgi:squalene synthase HpnC
VVQPDLSHPQDNREPARSSNGESGPLAAAALNTAEKETRRLAKSHYENFLVASVLLPRRFRQPFYNVYAFCRQADDLADQSPTPQLALERLDAFQRELNSTFAGRPGPDLFIALAHTIEQFELPKQPFDDLLDAFRQDQRVTRYQNFELLLDYCRRSANPVGRIVLSLGGACDDQTAPLSDEICTGLQLANFWQDVARDHAIGRIYLPLDEMNRFGVSEAMLGGSSTPPQLRQLLADQCDRAEGCFRRGLPLAQLVPRWLCHDVKLFAHGGLATLHAIRRIDFDILRTRPTVSKWRQSTVVVRALLGLL